MTTVAASTGPFNAYVTAAMRRSEYVADASSGDLAGFIPGLPGVCFTAPDGPSCEAGLKAVLEEWLLFRAARGLPIPPVEGLNVSAADIEGHSLLRLQFERLEKELEALRLRVGIASPPSGSRLGAFNEWYKSYFTLISSALALLALLLAYTLYSVDPFEAYRDTADKKQNADIIAKKAEYYGQLGDLMMDDMDYKGAAESYQEALKISPTNINATRGLLLSQLSQPNSRIREGSASALPLKLKLIEDNFKSDRRAALVKGIVYRDAGMYDEAIRTFEDCAGSPANYPLCSMELGFTYTWAERFDIDKAIAAFQAVVLRSPNNFLARYNLGTCYLLIENYECALQQLKVASAMRDHFGTVVSLGDAYLYEGNTAYAAYYYKHALTRLDEPKIAEGTFLGNYAIYNLMPVSHGDRETIKKSVSVVGVEEDRILANYLLALALAYAAQNPAQLKEAGEKFDAARRLDKSQKYRQLIANRIQSLLGVSKLSDKLKGDNRKWFEKRQTLQ